MIIVAWLMLCFGFLGFNFSDNLDDIRSILRLSINAILIVELSYYLKYFYLSYRKLIERLE